MKRLIVLLVATSCVALLSSDASAQLFRDQMTDPNAWGINKGPSTDSAATFGYDYSADGIPEAPGFQGGDTATSGVKLEANNGDFTDDSAFFTLYPLGQNFTGNYVLEFDMWMNYSVADRLDGAGPGTTEFGGGGIGYDGVTADIASGAQFMVTNEGGSSNDYRAFKSPPQFFIPDADMVAGTHNANFGSNSQFYQDHFPLFSGAPPAAQNQDPNHDGVGFDPNGDPVPNHQTNSVGSPGFQWATWQVSVDGNTVRTQVTNKLGDTINIVVYDKTDISDGSSGVSTDGNISIFYADFFTSITQKPQLTFGIVDNVKVTVPEPASLLMFGLGGVGFALIRRRR